MIRIAFCDDDLSVLDKLCILLDRYINEHDHKICYTTFQSAWALLDEIERGACFDILFLDVLMPGYQGIEAATEIRKHDNNVKIVFLTSSAEYAVQSYTVNAYYYQLKPISDEQFFNLMDSVLSACENEKSDSILLRCKNGITRIEIRHIEYCEVIHRTLYIHLSNGHVFESIGSLEDLSKQLEPYGIFLRPHRSYLINFEYVQSLSYKSLAMSCMVEIPIPRGKYHEIKDLYLEYCFKNDRVINV